ncbi:hypothetical protein JTE90_000230 [Oedothorax gibbosus]|uniref:Uncharacterized protein n=1 Tax=Oedothorax gibbosus TaxID=931172 RepID=A0AAV6VB64_9ARAC|nr:hypothetical protein JTE90_000230 [Oedothorax gibbosus]
MTLTSHQIFRPSIKPALTKQPAQCPISISQINQSRRGIPSLIKHVTYQRGVHHERSLHTTGRSKMSVGSASPWLLSLVALLTHFYQ